MIGQPTLVLIDGDALAYHSSREMIEDSILSLNDKIMNIFEKTKATHYVLFLSNTPYFRHRIDPEYKQNRSKYKTKLKWLKTLKSYMFEEWNAKYMKDVEADDLISYWMNKDVTIDGLLAEKIMSTPDKDLLNSIPGIHFNYTYNLEDKNNPNSLIKGKWVTTEQEYADKFKIYQMIYGDVSDNVTTIFPENCAIWNNSVGLIDVAIGYINGFEYKTPKKDNIKKAEGYGVIDGIKKFNDNYKLLHMLDCDADYIKEIGCLPAELEPIKINVGNANITEVVIEAVSGDSVNIELVDF